MDSLGRWSSFRSNFLSKFRTMGNCPCIDAPDDFNIKEQCRPGEVGAGWLKKQGKSRGNWSKRFFTLTDSKLIYYTDESRTVSKGEILLVGSSVKINDSISKKNFFAFTISHPVAGARELSAKTALRREQWVTYLTNVIEELDRSGAMCGNLLKKGGLQKTAWQERWCVLAGNTLTYFESMNDGIPKGTIVLTKAQIREFSAKDQKYCFEILASTKKGTKKYGFCVDSDISRRKWLSQLKKASSNAPPPVTAPEGATTGNPMSPTPVPDEYDPENDPEAGFSSAFSRKNKSEQAPRGKEGYLMKKSPNLLSGWQKRYFSLRAPGEIFYYENEKDFQKGAEPKGSIKVAEIMPDGSGVALSGVNEISIRIGKRTFHLQAADSSIANDWIEAINEWVLFLSSGD